ncbi:MAG: response regulator [Eubacteriales bacterium]|nr:response regulator [Eubacteriales bacterium]
MLQVMLIDDEPLALEGLKLLIDWHAEGFGVCAEYADARQALEKIQLTHPDLIVTDIRMPGMDGLELMRVAKQQGFNGQFIIVSGYNDFDYAARAMRIGVAGYLLKPIEPTEAAAVLEHVRRQLIGREASDAEHRLVSQRMMNTLLAGYDLPTDDLPAGGYWRLATWGAPLPYEAIREILAVYPEGTASAHIVEDKEFVALRWEQETVEPKIEAAEPLLRHYHRNLVVSERTADPRRLAALRSQLAAQLDTFCCSLTERVDALVRSVALRQADECCARCAELESYCATCGADARVRARQQLVSECARLFVDRPEQLSGIVYEQEAGFEALCLLAIRLLAPAQERISDRVIVYVQAHLSERLTIESIASALKYNATYLGRVFRDEQGKGFREWLADLRVQRAARLLTDTEENVSAVAERVGYTQYKRFLRHFKQRYGTTPDRYRRQKTQA